MILPHQARIEQGVEKVVSHLRRQGARAGDVHRHRPQLRVDGLSVEHAVRGGIDHAGGRGGLAPGELGIDDHPQQIAVQLADQAVDVRLVGALRAEPGQLGEREGVDYHFMTPEEFDQHVAAGDFVEHASYSGNRYGTLRSELERRVRAGVPVVLVAKEPVTLGAGDTIYAATEKLPDGMLTTNKILQIVAASRSNAQ